MTLREKIRQVCKVALSFLVVRAITSTFNFSKYSGKLNNISISTWGDPGGLELRQSNMYLAV